MKVDVPESEQRRFRLEARLCGGFNHPNLVQVLDVGTTREHGLFWFAMMFLDGKDIGGAMDAGHTVPLHVICEIFDQVLAGLQYVHVRNIVHRDIKPANIFVCRDPVDPSFRLVKVLDFGVAKDLNDEKGEDGKLILGDPRYMPPEQTRPTEPIDHRADLYALGMTFYEAITGHHPFEDTFGEHPKVTLKAHRNREPDPPSKYLPPDTDPEAAEMIDAFFQMSCAKNPDDRFADARAMQRALSALQRFA
jgi:serine/threonine-protein kinase